MLTRRDMLRSTGAGIAVASAGLLTPRWAAAAGVGLSPGVPEGVAASAVLDALDGKKPLIKLSYRPPNYETPLSYFNDVLTPNDAFFVRYHLSNIPEVRAEDWKLHIGGEAAEREVEFTLADLKAQFPAFETVAVCQCSGNRRGLSQPHVQGVEWGVGAMGNARWAGVRLKDVLAKAGVKKEAVEVGFNGADSGAFDKTPDFIKSIPVWRALDENTMIAFGMNGAPLPHWNGYPARLVIPGWTGTYWMKHVTAIDVRTKPLGGFWMNPAYRLPRSRFPVVDRFVTQETETTTPITEIVVNSLITNLVDNAKVKAGQPIELRGIAWDGGYGIEEVAVSVDGGQSWRPSKLGEDLGRFSFRPWRYRFKPAAGHITVLVKATNRLGASQPMQPVWNPAGYHHNAVQKIVLSVV